MIGSCAFGLECNSFKDPNSLFLKYGKRVFSRNTFERVLDLFALSFPNVAQALHVKPTPEDVSQFFSEVVKKTISHRESSKSTRNDFLQLLIDIRNNNEGKNILKNLFLVFVTED